MRNELNEAESRMEQFQTVAKNAGIKLTHQRLEIFREIISRHDHPDAETVFQAVRRRIPTVSLDTVYRTLWMLNDLGMISTLGPRRDSMRFDPHLSPHHHFVCVRCGSIHDFQSEGFDALCVPDSIRTLGDALRAHVEIQGVCRACADTSKENSSPHKSKSPSGKKRRSA